MNIPLIGSCVEYVGRWHVSEKTAVSTAPGAYMRIAFCGNFVELHFDTSGISERFPQIYAEVDKKERRVLCVSDSIRLEADSDGCHVATVIFKGARETVSRWTSPLVSRLCLTGITADAACTCENDERPIIEFIGDSITEGCGVYDDIGSCSVSPDTNDSTKTYAWQTAELLGMRPYITAYGSQGLTKGGLGGVPRAGEAYCFSYDNTPIAPPGAEIIVVNHGANDCDATDKEYISEYVQFLRLVRSRSPKAKIAVLSPFCGIKSSDAVLKAARLYEEQTGDKVLFVDGCGIIPKRPIHPNVDGHRKIAEFLSGKLKNAFM